MTVLRSGARLGATSYAPIGVCADGLILRSRSIRDESGVHWARCHIAFGPAEQRMALTPQFRRAQALRYRFLARKARRLASSLPGDAIAPRLIELAEKLEGDAITHEEEACLLLAEQTEDASDGSLPA
jgi:hypothetical protein